MKKKFILQMMLVIAVLSMSGLGVTAQNAAPYWSLGGNSNGSSASRLGTTNAVSLRFITSNADRMTLTSAGNLGIGINAPLQKLHVVGGTLITGNLGLGINPSGYKLQVKGNALITDALSVNGAGITVTSAGSTGVNSVGGSYGVVGSSSYVGVYGTGTSYGLYGNSSNGYGVYAYSSNSYAIYGTAERAPAIYGRSSSQVGVSGVSSNQVGVSGTSTNYHGGYFFSTNGYGMWAKTGKTGSGSYAGIFEGNVYAYGAYLTSDKTLKKNIENFDHAMDIISELKPAFYEFKNDGKYASLHLPTGKHYGLMAQDVEEILPGLVGSSVHEVGDDQPEPAVEAVPEAPGINGELPPTDIKLPPPYVSVKKETITIKAVNYVELIPIMIKAIQEQQATIEDLKEKIKILSLRVGSSKLDGAYMEQNTPNPVKTSTIIRYSLPSSSHNASITLTNMKGQLIRTLTLNGPGEGQLSVNRGALAAGTYTYTLYVDGERIESKKMLMP
ncbi:MAG: tail fiber domain-containing protein [Flavitalea sp.]